MNEKTPYSCTGNLNTVDMSLLPKLSYRFNATPIKTLKQVVCVEEGVGLSV